MKLFVFAALVAAAAAARLEHLERRAYLPPFQGSNSAGSFGSQSQGSFGSNGAFGSAGAGQDQNGAFGLATSNKYLPPDHSSSNGAPQFSGSLTGFGPQNSQGQQFGQQGSQYTIPSTAYGTPQLSNFGSQSQYSQQAGANQYLAPRPSALENPPQQAFDEETGYHY